MNSSPTKIEKSGGPAGAKKGPEPPIEKKKEENTPITNTHRIAQAPETGRLGEIRVNHVFTMGEPTTKIFNIRFSEDDKYIAAACENGQIQVYNTTNGKLCQTFHASKNKEPFSSVRWRSSKGAFSTKNVIVSTNADGMIQHWHLGTGKCLDTVKETGSNPQLYSLDFNADSSKFAVVGSDCALKIYDEETKKQDLFLTGEACVVPGHGSRVYCVKFDPDNSNMVVTGGWDYRLILWDLRQKQPIDFIPGPLTCGDGIDIFDDTILAASWTDKEQLATYDIGTRKRIDLIDWMAGPKTSQPEPCFLYSGQFSKLDGGLILAGGSNTNEAKLFDSESGNKHIATITDLSREIYTVDFANNGGFFAISGGDAYIRMFSFNVWS